MAVNTLLKLPLTVSLADDLEVESRYFLRNNIRSG